MYEIKVEPVEKPNSKSEKTRELLETMMDVMTNIEYVDDAGFVLRMKVMNNIEFLVDELMFEYENSKF
jgi:hypothetical protein